jgi:D-2-hydroxyacid dehydrogenase (NADP+)
MRPTSDQLSICFAHVACWLHKRFCGAQYRYRRLRGARFRGVGEAHRQADVLVISGLWRDSLLDRAERLRFIQSIRADTNQFPRDKLKSRGIRYYRTAEEFFSGIMHLPNRRLGTIL